MRILVLTLIWAIAVAAAVPADAGSGAPPVQGGMQNFIALDEPVPAPSTPILSKNEGPITLDRFHGKFIVLNFWATWCGPCVRELPSLQRLHDQLAGDDFAVVLVSQDRGGFDQTDPFLRKHRITIPDTFVDDKLKFSRASGVRALPTTLLIGPDGKEVGRLLGAAEWDQPDALALIEFYRAKYRAARPAGERHAARPVELAEATGGGAAAAVQRVGTGVSPE